VNGRLTLRAPSRIHICLSDMGNVSFRRFGGIGFAVGAAISVCRIERSEKTEIITSQIEDPFCCDGLRHLIECMAREFRLANFRLSLLQSPPQHTGFGSMTTAVLSSLVLLNEYFKLGLSATDLQIRSNRGGASGIGVHAFFGGGVIWDGGHENASSLLVPSRYAQPTTVPPLLARAFSHHVASYPAAIR
jgi:beta-ribofuranosylaminobenzene 5'-phosphate synthase